MTCSCGTPTRDNAYVCDKCLADLTKALAETPWLVDQLEITLTKQRGVDYAAMGSTGSSKEQPLPLNTGAFEAASQLRATLLAWVRHCELNNTRNQSPHTHRPRPEPIPMSAWLLWRVDGLAFDEKGGDAVADIVRAFDKGKRVVDRPADKWFAGPCNADLSGRECGRDMYAAPGKPDVKCPACAAIYDVKARREWLLESAKDSLATATEIGRAITVLSEATKGQSTMVRLVGDWATAGRLTVRGHVIRRGQERPTYRVGDVVALVEAHMAREQARRVVS